MTFTAKLAHAICHVAIDDVQRPLILRAIADTVACAAAGADEPATRKALSAYQGDGPQTWSGDRAESFEAALLCNAVSAHALDFDDVCLESTAHVSASLVPAILAPDHDDHPDDVINAYAAGHLTARVMGARLGQGHYQAGWHGTGTVGTFACAAAAARLLRLSPQETAAALAIAGSLAAGLKVAFGSETKPLHAGFAASAGWRAARLAQAGITTSPHVLEDGGFPDLYGGADRLAHPADALFIPAAGRNSVKLFPCCYAAHRLIGAALQARDQIGGAAIESISLHVPAGSLAGLKYDRPQTGLEAKFSAPYAVATTLLYGIPTVAHFTDSAARDPAILALMERLEVIEDASQPSGGDITFGTLVLHVALAQGSIEITRAHIPGSPEDPPEERAMLSKIADCLGIFHAQAGRPYPAGAQVARLGDGIWTGAFR